MYDYCKRVSWAFRKIRDNHLTWPGVTRCEFLSNEMESDGFPGCIGIGDGSFIRLVDKPLKDGWSYWSRKKFYAVSIILLFSNDLTNSLI